MMAELTGVLPKMNYTYLKNMTKNTIYHYKKLKTCRKLKTKKQKRLWLQIPNMMKPTPKMSKLYQFMIWQWAMISA